MEYLSNDHKNHPNQHENNHKQWNWASHFEFDGTSMETETTTWSEFPNGGKAILEQILASGNRNKSKRAGLWESQSGIWVGKLAIWVRSFEIHQVYQFHQNRLASPHDRY